MHTLERSNKHFHRIVLAVFFSLGFVLLAVSFIRLQISNKAMYQRQSRNNSIRAESLYPVRGLIRDKTGRILVDTRAQFSAAVIPVSITAQSLRRACEILGLDTVFVQKKIKNGVGFRPVIIDRDISQEQLVAIEENRIDLPGIITLEVPKRFYANNVNSPHIFGTIGEVNKAEQIINPIYEAGDLVGKSGIEKKYDLDLRGTKGVRYLRVDASGKTLGAYDESQNISPVHGNDIYLHLDYSMQQFAESLLVDYRGALVAIDVRDGGIIAMASKPDYDPRLLSGKIDPEIWKRLIEDENHPLYSRAIQSAYPPGSTYKIVAAIAALQEKIITPQWEATCNGSFRLGRKTIRCWNPNGHGTLDLYGAIKNSCNVYFYKLGLKIGLDFWSKYSKMLGFGSKTGIDLPNENSGLVPTREFFDRVYGKNGWTRGNLANLAIGQGELLVTPLQLAQFAMILANKGVYYTPHMVEKMYDFSARAFINFPKEVNYVKGISKDVYDVVREGMHRVVNGGTGWLGRVPGIDMAGKTGTAQNPHGEPHAWFMAFAPYESPEVAISVIVENAGGGGAIAAPIARKFLEKYFYGKLIARPVVKKDKSGSAQDSLLFPIPNDSLQPMQLFLPDEGTE